MLIRTDFIRKIHAAASRNAEDLKMVRIRLYPENGFSVLIRINNAAGGVCTETQGTPRNRIAFRTYGDNSGSFYGHLQTPLP